MALTLSVYEWKVFWINSELSTAEKKHLVDPTKALLYICSSPVQKKQGCETVAMVPQLFKIGEHKRRGHKSNKRFIDHIAHLAHPRNSYNQ